MKTYGYAFFFSLTGYFGISFVLALIKLFGALVAVTGQANKFTDSCLGCTVSVKSDIAVFCSFCYKLYCNILKRKSKKSYDAVYRCVVLLMYRDIVGT